MTVGGRVVLAGVGRLVHATLRPAIRGVYTWYAGHFEIVSMTGMLPAHGSRIHLAIPDGTGRTIGGRLVSGCRVCPTAEIVLAVFDEVVCTRELLENDCGYEELAAYPLKQGKAG